MNKLTFCSWETTCFRWLKHQVLIEELMRENEKLHQIFVEELKVEPGNSNRASRVGVSPHVLNVLNAVENKEEDEIGYIILYINQSNNGKFFIGFPMFILVIGIFVSPHLFSKVYRFLKHMWNGRFVKVLDMCRYHFP